MSRCRAILLFAAVTAACFGSCCSLASIVCHAKCHAAVGLYDNQGARHAALPVTACIGRAAGQA